MHRSLFVLLFAGHALAAVVEFRQTGKGAPLSTLPDLAIAREEARDRSGLEIPVHNVGAAASRPFTVTVRDGSGKTLGESRQTGLAAPLDLKPKVALVRFPGIGMRPGLRISVAQEGGAATKTARS